MSRSRALAAVLGVLLLLGLAAARIHGTDYESARFQLSSDPAQLILRFQTKEGPVIRAMSLYGDGRLELRLTEKTLTRERFERELAYHEMVELVRRAVDHGFAEWTDSVNFPGNRGMDSPTATGELHLASYRRGPVAEENLSQSFRFGNIGLAQKVAGDVIQVQGLVALLQALDAQFETARRDVQR